MELEKRKDLGDIVWWNMIKSSCLIAEKDSKNLYAHVIQIQHHSRKCWMHTADMCLYKACSLICCLYFLVKVLKYVLTPLNEQYVLFSLRFCTKYSPSTLSILWIGRKIKQISKMRLTYIYKMTNLSYLKFKPFQYIVL